MDLKGTLLIKPGSGRADGQGLSTKLLDDQECWLKERQSRAGTRFGKVQVPFESFDQAMLEGVTVIKQERKNSPKRWQITFEKSPGNGHEDRIWRLFDRMDAEALSATRVHFDGGKLYARHNPMLEVEVGKGRQVDVVARLGKYVFFVEAKDEASYAGARAYLDRLAGMKNSAEKIVEELFPGASARVVLWYSQTEMPDRDLLQAARDRSILFLTGAHLDYYEGMLEEQLLARHSFIRDQLKGERFWHSDLYYPAIRIQISGAKEFFCGVGKPAELMQASRVDRRSPIKEQSYQRLIKVDKVRNARKYLESFHKHVESRGIFGNSILLVCDDPVDFEPFSIEKDRNVGFVRIPATYGVLSVVDGQHRLFSYIGTERQANRELPFVLFPGTNEEFARSMFVSINDNQQKIPSELMWDILADLEPDEEEEKDGRDYRKHMIARVARGLALQASSPLAGAISVYGLPEDFKEEPHITLTTICSGMEKLQLLRLPKKKGEAFTLRNPQVALNDEATIVQQAMEKLLNTWIVPLREKMAEDWKAQRQGRIFNNNAMAVHLYSLDLICQDLLVGSSTLEQAVTAVKGKAGRYVQFWQKQVELDDRAAEDDSAQRLSKGLSSEGTRKDFAVRAADFVLDRPSVKT